MPFSSPKSSPQTPSPPSPAAGPATARPSLSPSPAAGSWTAGPSPEQWSSLAIVPIVATLGFYTLPNAWQERMLVQFLPQILAYLALAWWAWHNTHPLARLGLTRDRLWLCLSWGVGTGLVLGALNTAVMLWIVPWLGGDLEFLRDIPHARVPTPLMWPWTIVVIAALVELNFRGFLLGRLLTLSQQMWRPPVSWLGPAVAIGLAAGIFAFDPFLVATFRHLHWIGVWDAVIWGLLWVRFRNLAVPVVAHAMEVSLEYAVMKWTLTGEI